MSIDIIKALHNRKISYHPMYKDLTGSLQGAIVLSQIMYWFKQKDKFYKTDAEMMRETRISKHEMNTAKTTIKKLDFIKITKEGIPAKTFYEIDWQKYKKTMNIICKKDSKKHNKKTPTQLAARSDVQLAARAANLPSEILSSNTNSTSDSSSDSSFSSFQEECVSGETLNKGSETLIKDNVVAQNKTQNNIVEQKNNVAQNKTQNNIVESSLKISDRKKVKPTKKIKQKYKHNNIVERCYVQAVNAKATHHTRNDKGNLSTQAGIDTLDKIYALLNPKIQNPYYYANNVTEEYIDRKWKTDEVIESFKFHMKHSTKDKQIRNFGKFIFTEGFKETKPWSPLLHWHTQMKQGITGKLTEEGEKLLKCMKQENIMQIDKLSANEINKIAKELTQQQASYVCIDGGMWRNNTYIYGLISIAVKYIKDKQNKFSDFKWFWITKKTFVEELIVEALRLNIIRKEKNLA